MEGFTVHSTHLWRIVTLHLSAQFRLLEAKLPWAGWCKQQWRLTSYGFGFWTLEMRVAGFWWELSFRSQVADFPLFSLMAERVSFWFLHIRTLIPFLEFYSHDVTPPKVPPPNTITLRLGCQHTNLGGPKHLVHNTISFLVCIYKNYWDLFCMRNLS